MIIRNIADLASHLGTTTNRIEHDLYKETECGAWIHWDNRCVNVGSIVEGCEAEFSNRFYFPFDSDEFDYWIEDLEELCDEAWHDANDDDPVEIVREMTEPCMDISLEDAANIIKKANDIYYVPASLTPEVFLEIYEDLEPGEED